MPLVYTKEEVKEYLAQRGFDVTDDNLVNKFIHDIKKMIKYEDRMKRRMRLGHDPQETTLESSMATVEEGEVSLSSSRSSEEQGQNQDQGRRSLASTLSRSRKDEHVGSSNKLQSSQRSRTSTKKVEQKKELSKTEAQRSSKSLPVGTRGVEGERKSGTRSKPQSGSIIKTAVMPSAAAGTFSNLRRPGTGTAGTQRSTVSKPMSRQRYPLKSKQTEERAVPSSQSKPLKGQASGVSGKENKERKRADAEGVRSSVATLVPKSQLGSKSAQPFTLQTGKADETSELLFMLESLLGSEVESNANEYEDELQSQFVGPPPAVARDPVRLYHYYKKYWDNNNFPGEDRHMQLRWNVRAETEGRWPCVDGRPIDYLGNARRRKSKYCGASVQQVQSKERCAS